MENTLLYCRVAPDGTLIHNGEKFSKLLQHNPFVPDGILSSTNIIEKKANIDRFIQKSKKWLARIEYHNKNGLQYGLICLWFQLLSKRTV